MELKNGNGTVLEISNLKKSFGKNEVLKNISLTLKRGENLVILGKSGSGKSVLIKCIVRLVKPDDGTLSAFDKNILNLNMDELNDLRRKIGFLFQGAALYDSMTVRENLEFPLRHLTNFTKAEKLSRVEEALQNVGLYEAINKMPSELSGGMRKRVGLARTMMLKPEIMLYDEPTTGLDPATSREISNLILKVQEKYGTSSIIITHDISCTKITSNRILVLKNGLFIAEGTYNELENSKDKSVRSFFEV